MLLACMVLAMYQFKGTVKIMHNNEIGRQEQQMCIYDMKRCLWNKNDISDR